MSTEVSPEYYDVVGKFVDILVGDPYFTAASKGVYKYALQMNKDVKNEKPVYTLLKTYGREKNMKSADNVRNMDYQALLAGSEGIGYFSISDGMDFETSNQRPLWENNSCDTWNGMVLWGTVEKKIIYDHFVFDKSPKFNQDIDFDNPYWYYSWAVDGAVYMVVLGMVDGQSLENVSIPLTSTDGSVAIGSYTAEVIASKDMYGATNVPPVVITGQNNLNITVNSVEATLYKITPSSAVDFSSLR